MASAYPDIPPYAIIVYVWKNGVWVKVGEPRLPNNHNFVITNPHGDWSGFRSLDNCLKQQMDNRSPNNYYRIVER